MQPVVISETIVQAHRVPGLAPKGRYVAVAPDLFLLPEYAVALLAARLDAMGGPCVGSEQVLVAADHFSPPSSIERAEILAQVEAWVAKVGWEKQFRLMEGISHQLLLEDSRLGAGKLVIGSDSHTVTAGVAGAWASGFGSLDLLYALRTGMIWLEPSAAVAVVLRGSGCPSGVMGKDVILEVFRRLGPEGLHRKTLEFFLEDLGALPYEERIPLCNMVVDGGATNGLFAQEPWSEHAWRLPAYDQVLEIELSALEPLLALPGSPFRIAPVREHVGTRITQAYLGSCSAGRISDFEAFSQVVMGKKVANHVRAIAIASSQQIYIDVVRLGYAETVLRAGVVLSNPSCGPCGGIDKGILGRNDVCIATMNRNFQGRMGSPEALIWFANAAVVAASALAGAIALPE